MTHQLVSDIIAGPAGGGEHFLRIGDVALRTGLTQRTIRYYEELGLLPMAGRTQGDFRLFSEHDIKRLERIVKLRDLFRFSLAEIRDTIAAEESLDQLRSEFRGTEDVGVKIQKLDQARELVRSQLGLLDRRVAQMQELKGELEARLARYASKRGQLEAELDGPAAGAAVEEGS